MEYDYIANTHFSLANAKKGLATMAVTSPKYIIISYSLYAYFSATARASLMLEQMFSAPRRRSKPFFTRTE